jgi:hypothetical protein
LHPESSCHSDNWRGEVKRGIGLGVVILVAFWAAIDVVVENLRLWPGRTFGISGKNLARVGSAFAHRRSISIPVSHAGGSKSLPGSVFIHIELKLSWPIEYAVFKFLELPEYFVAYAPKAHVSNSRENQDARRYFL